MSHCLMHRVMLVIHGEAPPSDAEWAAYLADGERAAKVGTLRAILVVTDGSGPNAQQRTKLKALGQIRGTPAAVVTTSTIARGIVTALDWLGNKIRAFSPDELSSAFDYLCVDESERASLTRAIATLKFELVVGAPLEGTLSASSRLGDVEAMMKYVVNERLATIRKRVAAGR